MAEKQRNAAMGGMVLAILFVALNLRPAISSIGPMLEPIRADLNLSNSEVSLLTAVPVFCMGLFAPLAVLFGRKFGLKRSIAVLLLAIGVFTLVRGFMPTYPVLLASAFFIGLSIAIISPLLSAMIKRDFPMRTAALIGVFSFGMGLGATLSAGLTGVFYSVADWPLAIASWSLLSIAAVVIWLRVEQPAEEKSERSGLEEIARISPWKNKRAWYMLLFFGCQSALFFSMLTWLAPIAIEKGMSVLAAGGVLTLMSAVQIAGNISIPLFFNKFPNRLGWILAVLSFGTVGILLLMFGSVTAVWAAAAFIGVALGGLFPIALLMPLDETASADEANSWTAMTQSGGYIISAFMPLTIGILYDQTGNHSVTLTMLLIFILLMVIFAVLLNRKD
ncbi:CP family cyanate transporter-like MFS transporter [Planomicrobium stackebrandtii]|uniref:CP family cyanate transporter-like MFS transporter n=1 Tax=Planomicrobium stackebrandtii TaxID=253160 RepID=A0ABU0GQ15_9BACL|nr:MFS transporter [Planomicrobium stackebrandtii]MDQ0427455.1 CP family cyanate transporter-like MFS transporter [Planomicrobium stackebrandtii]